jgi:TonB family protein
MRKGLFGMLALLALMLAEGIAARPAQQPDAPQAPALPPLPSYPDSSEGLENFIRTALEAAKNGDNKLLYAHTRSLLLRDPETTFRELFGDALPDGFAEDYRKRSAAMYLILARDLTKIAQEGFAEIRVLRYEEGCSPQASDNQAPVLLARRQPAALYDVRILKKKNDKTAAGLWFFLYQGDGFRYLGNVTLPDGAAVFGPFFATGDSGNGQPAKRIRVDGTVQSAKLIESPAPVYPPQAKAARLQGTVRLIALLGKDGHVKALRLVTGHCWLAQATIDAVKKWRYQPTLLNGEPVEVFTTIDVIFSLSDR